tara:strand:- start:405 stop:1610 length:1206 start_codon:yes stop_codon:yes gene_type:complete
MGSKDPIQVAREILERDLASTTEQEEILESVEEVEEDIEIVEDDLEEMAHGDKKKKSEAMHDDEDEDEDDEEDTDEMAHGDKKKMKKEAYETYGMVKSGMHKGKKMKKEAEEILGVDDNQDAEGKKGTPTPKGGKKQPEPKMKPSSASAKMETMHKMKEHADALFGGEDLSEEFKNKAITVFEAAVHERVTAIESDLLEQYEQKLSEEVEEVTESLTTKLDDYLNYVVEEWMQENELAVDSGIRTEVAESFMDGLKSLFEEHYIEMPEGKDDLLEASVSKVSELEDELNEQIEKNIVLSKELLENTCVNLFNEVTEGLVDTEVEKLRSLAEGLEFESAEQYKEKLSILKESYFEKSNPEASNFDSALTEEVDTSSTTPDASGPMADYIRTLSKHSNYNKLS